MRKSNREAAGLEGGETIEVPLDLDTDERVIKPPADFAKALKAMPPAWERWRELSYSHQREHVEAIEGAKAPETRARRIDRAARAHPADTRAKAIVYGVTVTFTSAGRACGVPTARALRS